MMSIEWQAESCNLPTIYVAGTHYFECNDTSPSRWLMCSSSPLVLFPVPRFSAFRFPCPRRQPPAHVILHKRVKRFIQLLGYHSFSFVCHRPPRNLPHANHVAIGRCDEDLVRAVQILHVQGLLRNAGS